MQVLCAVHASFMRADSFGVPYALWCAVSPCFQAHPTIEAATAAASAAAAEWFLDASPFGIMDAGAEASNAAAWAALQAWFTSVQACPDPAAHAAHAALHGDAWWCPWRPALIAEPEEPAASGFTARVMATIDAMNEDDEEAEEEAEQRNRWASLDAHQAAYADEASAPAA